MSRALFQLPSLRPNSIWWLQARSLALLTRSCGNQIGTPSLSLMLLDRQALSRWESNLSGKEFELVFSETTYWTPIICQVLAPHSSILAWKIPWMEKPGRLQSMGSLRVGHDWASSLSLFTFTHWRRKWQPTPVFLPGESQGQGSLVGCCLWGCTESDTTEVT